MKIGAESNPFNYFPSVEEKYRYLLSLGYEAVDESLSYITQDIYHDVKKMEEYCAMVRSAAEKTGMIIGQVHGPWPTDDTTPKKREKVLDYMRRAVYGCHLMGSPYLVIHPQMPYGWVGDVDVSFCGARDGADYPEEVTVKLLNDLMPDCEKYNVVLCLENMPFKEQRISRVPYIVKAVEQVKSPNIGVCLDTGHANVFGDDLGEMVRCAAPYLKTLHVHDNDGRSDQHVLPYQGTIDWDAFTSALKDIGFKGVFSMETVMPMKPAMPEDIRHHAAQLTAKIARHLADKSE